MLFRGVPENFRSDRDLELIAKRLRQWMAKLSSALGACKSRKNRESAGKRVLRKLQRAVAR
jgi:hypothetical protein